MPKKLKLLIYLILVAVILLAFKLVYRENGAYRQQELILHLPSSGVDYDSLAVLVKEDDSFSAAVAERYVKARRLDPQNVFTIKLPDKDVVSEDEFVNSYAELTETIPDKIQAFVATWQRPYRVDCMSITSALAFGFDKQWCQPEKGGCNTTKISPYYGSSTSYPWRDLKIRPAMLLTGKDMNAVNDLINRGVSSDLTNPSSAIAYLVTTRDRQRSSRSSLFNFAGERFRSGNIRAYHLDLSNEARDYIKNERVFIYQTGLANVPEINSIDYLPGAVADHLTSFGGKGFSRGGQMKAIRWLEAGATGSYGTVGEPCNYPEKFPNPNVLIPMYSAGGTLLEAYWKSVRMPGEGLFLGDPLARPFGVLEVKIDFGRLTIRTNLLDFSKFYGIFYLDSKKGIYKPLQKFTIYRDQDRDEFLIQFKALKTSRYKIVELTPKRNRLPLKPVIHSEVENR